jgi:hypothetical protein
VGVAETSFRPQVRKCRCGLTYLPRSVPGVRNRFAGLVANHFAGGESTFAQAAEEIELARIVGAGNEVKNAIAIEIHDLRTGADASVNRNLGVDAARLEIDRFGITRLLIGPPHCDKTETGR